MNIQELISDSEVDRIHANSNFGCSKRDVIRYGILKCASGYYQGHTSKTICIEHGLINKKYELTEKGRKYLWAAFGEDHV
jgi:hypothetical protein